MLLPHHTVNPPYYYRIARIDMMIRMGDDSHPNFVDGRGLTFRRRISRDQCRQWPMAADSGSLAWPSSWRTGELIIIIGERARGGAKLRCHWKQSEIVPLFRRNYNHHWVGRRHAPIRNNTAPPLLAAFHSHPLFLD